MKFLVDENVGLSVVKYLRSKNYDVSFVSEDVRGIKDRVILDKTNKENRILVTNDKDFGDLIFYHSLSHKGVVLLRLKDESSQNKISAIEKLLRFYKKQLAGNFVVVTEDKVRIKHS